MESSVIQLDSVSSNQRLSAAWKSVRSFGFVSSLSAVTIVLSVASNKIISIVAGPAGVGTVGLFRNLSTIVLGAFSFGFSTALIQAISSARTKQNTDTILFGQVLLSAVQFLAVAIAILILAQPISRWISGGTDISPTTVAVVMTMGLCNIFYESVQAVLKGKGAFYSLSLTQLATSLMTLAIVLPLLKLGNLGLALNAGTGGIIGTLLGIGLILRSYRPTFKNLTLKAGLASIQSLATPSLTLTVSAVLNTGSFWLAMLLMNSHFGTAALGGFTAACMVVETAIMVLAAPMRSYFLPLLAKLDGTREKSETLSHMLMLLITTTTLGAIVLMMSNRLVVSILFSKAFESTVLLLPIMSLALLGHGLCWCFNTYLFHLGRILDFVIIDAFFKLLFLASVFILIKFTAAPIYMIGWAYSVSLIVGGLVYVVYCWWRFGSDIVSNKQLLFIAGSAAVMGFVFYLQLT